MNFVWKWLRKSGLSRLCPTHDINVSAIVVKPLTAATVAALVGSRDQCEGE
jgi:hypothetical protein